VSRHRRAFRVATVLGAALGVASASAADRPIAAAKLVLGEASYHRERAAALAGWLPG
jgi:hypothetical protein